MPRTLREVVFVDGVRTPFGKAGEKGIYAQTRADDLVVKCIRELLRRHPELPPGAGRRGGHRGDDADRRPGPDHRAHRRAPVGPAAVRPRAIAIDRMCAGAMTAVTTTRRARSPSVPTTSPSPAGSSTWVTTPWVRASTPTRASSPSGSSTRRRSSWARPPRTCTTASRSSPRSAPTRSPSASQAKLPGGLRRRQDPARPRRRRDPPAGARLGSRDERRAAATRHDGRRPRCPEDPVPAHGRVTAGNSAGLNDGATACLLASEDGRGRARPAGADAARVLRLRRCRTRGDGRRARPGHREGAALRRAVHRGHRALRAQRGVRRAGARLPRPLRHRRRRPAGQPLRRRDRHRAPARVLRRAPDDPAGAPVRGPPGGPLRPHRDVRRPRAWAAPSSGRTRTTPTTTTERPEP